MRSKAPAGDRLIVVLEGAGWSPAAGPQDAAELEQARLVQLDRQAAFDVVPGSAADRRRRPGPGADQVGPGRSRARGRGPGSRRRPRRSCSPRAARMTARVERRPESSSSAVRPRRSRPSAAARRSAQSRRPPRGSRASLGPVELEALESMARPGGFAAAAAREPGRGEARWASVASAKASAARPSRSRARARAARTRRGS